MMLRNIRMTTNITDLPSASAVTPLPAGAPPQQDPQQPSQSQISALVAGIQKASAAGATTLPSRDIPQHTNHIVQDTAAAPNHVPEPPPAAQYYIPDEDPQQAIQQREASATKSNALEELYSEVHVPLLVTVLFLMFQLPIVQKYFRNALPFAFNADGNQNIIGYVSYSALFGLSFYGIITFIQKAK
jgi:hypothetical protein